MELLSQKDNSYQEDSFYTNISKNCPQLLLSLFYLKFKRKLEKPKIIVI